MTTSQPHASGDAIADRVMIADLIARYAHLLDYGHGREREFAALFCEEGRFEIPSLGVLYQGRAALEQLALTAHAAQREMHHVCSNVVIDLEGDTAQGRVHFNGFVLIPGRIHSYSQGHYADHYVRRAGRWYFSVRQVHMSSMARELMVSEEMQRAGVAIIQSFPRRR